MQDCLSSVSLLLLLSKHIKLAIAILLIALFLIDSCFGFSATRLPIVNGMSPVLGGIWVVGSQGMEEMVAEIGGVLDKRENSRGIWESSILSKKNELVEYLSIWCGDE